MLFKNCMMITSTELYTFTTVLVTVAHFQNHRKVQDKIKWHAYIPILNVSRLTSLFSSTKVPLLVICLQFMFSYKASVGTVQSYLEYLQTLWSILKNQVWDMVNSSQDTGQMVSLRSLWPWTWRQQPKLFPWLSVYEWCISTPSLATKGSAVQKICQGKTFLEDAISGTWTLLIAIQTAYQVWGE